MAQDKGDKTNTYAVKAEVSPKLLCSANPKRTCVAAYNNGSVTAYVTSAQSKPYTEGRPIIAGADYVNDTTTAELWILTATSSSDIRVQEDGN